MMKKILSAVLSLAIILSVTLIPTDAAAYSPSGYYSVSADTPTCEEAIEACGGDLEDTQTIYFQAPFNDGEHPVWENKLNTFPGPDNDEPYMHVCVYWWEGVGSKWPNGAGSYWVGYQAHLVDKENRIYSAKLPASGTPVVVWNNGVNGGTDSSAEIFSYARQIMDVNIEGALPGDYDTLPEGSPDPDSMDRCIQIIDYDKPYYLSGYVNYRSSWYVYYGDGCYGEYPEDSPNYLGKHASCMNPEHDHSSDTYILGDADSDGEVTVLDVTAIQRVLADLSVRIFNEKAADVDGDGLNSTDATCIQRRLAEMKTPYRIGEAITE